MRAVRQVGGARLATYPAAEGPEHRLHLVRRHVLQRRLAGRAQLDVVAGGIVDALFAALREDRAADGGRGRGRHSSAYLGKRVADGAVQGHVRRLAVALSARGRQRAPDRGLIDEL